MPLLESICFAVCIALSIYRIRYAAVMPIFMDVVKLPDISVTMPKNKKTTVIVVATILFALINWSGVKSFLSNFIL